MDLTPLKSLRVRRMADSLGTALLAGLAVGALAIVGAVYADALAGLPWSARMIGIGAAGVAILTGIILAVRRSRRADWSLVGTARFASARADGSANALASYLELSSGSLPDYVARRVEAAATTEAASLRPGALVDLGRVRTLSVVLVALVVAAVVPGVLGYDLVGRFLTLPEARASGGEAGVALAPGSAVDAGDRLSVTIVPPAYTGVASMQLDTPSEIVAPAGARIEVELLPGLPAVTADVSVNGAEPSTMATGPSGALVASFSAVADGSVAVRPAISSAEREPFLLPLRVVPDRAPEVRIVMPKGDVLVEPAARPQALTVEFEASDDFGLGPVRLKYIRSTGEGDAAEFVSGELPVTLGDRRPDGHVAGRCVIDLDKAGVVPGASLVYHVEAQDRNSVTGPSTGMSESLVFEVAAPKPPASVLIGEIRPEDLQRYLVSQRMILEHTLKLEAERPKLPRDQFLRRSSEIAGEQRDFKESFSQFVEVHDVDDHDHDSAKGLTDEKSFDEAQRKAADEAAEEGAPDAEGREANEAAADAKRGGHSHASDEGTPRTTPIQEVEMAVRAMWDAEGSLGIGETAAAIPHEKRALEHLKRAQRAVRYFSRVRVTTKPIDLKRRYAGELADVKTRVERLAKRELSPEEIAIRSVLTDLHRELQSATALDPDRATETTAARATEIGERVTALGASLLRIETGYEPALVAVAARLSAAAADARRLGASLGDGDAARARSALTALDEGMLWSAGQLAALLDARTTARGGLADAPAGDRRAAEYFRRLAGDGR